MRQNGLQYELLSHKRTGVALAVEFGLRNLKLSRIVKEYRPHFMTGVMGPSIAVVGRLRCILFGDRVRTAIFYGTEMATMTNRFAYPMANYVCTPDCCQRSVSGDHRTFPSYLSMAYLAPKRFTPDQRVVGAAGVDITKPYFLTRFVSYEASHDMGTHGIPLSKKMDLVHMLEKRGRVLVSSEQPLPKELEPYRLTAPVSQIHHFLAYATALIGESATMASECAVLGTLASYVSPVGRGFTDEQEQRYGLVVNCVGENHGGDWLSVVRRTLDDSQLAARVRAGRERLLADKVDHTNWMVDFFEREYARHFARSG